MKKVKVLFICMGNICRSPTAHGVFEQLLEQHGLAHAVAVDSAGTHAYHVGEAPDKRSQQVARERGYELGHLRARRVENRDFEDFDYVLAMDNDNYNLLAAQCPGHQQDKLQMFLDYAQNFSEREVPDPYYGGARGFQHVLDLVEDAALGLIHDIQRRHLS